MEVEDAIEFLATYDRDNEAADILAATSKDAIAAAEEKLNTVRLDHEIKQANAELLEAQRSLVEARSQKEKLRSPFLLQKEKEARLRVQRAESAVQSHVDSMVRAAKEGHLHELQRIIGFRKDPYNRKWGGVVGQHQMDAQDVHGYTALHQAATHGHQMVVSCLLEAGSEVNCRNSYGRSPLHMASIHGHRAVVKLLIEADARVNCQDNKGRTPLHEAALIGNMELVDMLLDKEANAWLKTQRGWSSSAEAKSRGHTELAEKLEALEASGKKQALGM